MASGEYADISCMHGLDWIVQCFTSVARTVLSAV